MKSDSKRLTIRISSRLNEAIKELAAFDERTVTNLIVYALRRLIAVRDRDGRAPLRVVPRERQTVKLTFRIKVGLTDALGRVASLDGHSKSRWAGFALEAYVAERFRERERRGQ